MMPLSETGSLGVPGALVAALALGCAFGWCLERAGLASAPKLAGQFYLTDFSVFKVMFSALLTAMLGAYWLDQLGLLDLNLVYLPETYVVPQAIGGILFGAGFLVAGLCPGTSCVAAATGRGDGLAVIGGLLFGVFMFNMSYSQVESLYNSTALGAVTLHGWIGMSPGLAIALLVVLALAGFALAERLVPTPSVHPHAEPVRTTAIHRAMVLIAVVLASAAATRDVRRTDARTLATEIQSERDHISAPDLADLIIGGDATLRVFDLRAAADFEQTHIPGARHMTIDMLAREPLPRDATIVWYSEGGAHAAQAWVLLRMRGYARVLFLREGLYEWLARVMEPRLAIDATESERADFAGAVERSRFFGGLPRDRVPRADVPDRILDHRVQCRLGRGHTCSHRAHAADGRTHPEAGMLMRTVADVATLRTTEFARLDRTSCAYLDYAGAALYPQSLVRRDARRLVSRVMGNPHADSAPSRASTHAIETARTLTLRLLDADPTHYDVIFTANASSALRIIAETFPFRAGSHLVLTADNHNSVNGLRVRARRRGASVIVHVLSTLTFGRSIPPRRCQRRRHHRSWRFLHSPISLA